MNSQTEPTNQKQPDRNPYTLWFVILSFAAPVVASYYMFFFGDITSFSNNGEFIAPYYNIEKLQLKKDGEAFNGDSMNKRWMIMMVAGSSCDQDCQKKLTDLRQISKAVKRPVKIRYGLVQTAQPDAEFESFINEEMQGAVILTTASGIFDDMPLNGQLSEKYLADPQGYMVMRFPHELSYKLVISDLNRLF